MIPGPNTYYQCPKCDAQFCVGSIMSGNTARMQSYSDGRQIAPMLPQFPVITKCHQCQELFWVSEAKVVGVHHWDQPMPVEWEQVAAAGFLNLYAFAEALEKQLAKTPQQECYLRIGLWRGFNDRVREGLALFASEYDEALWSGNIQKLIPLLDKETTDQKLLWAELLRNTGDFQGCLKIIKSLKGKELKWIKGLYRTACKKKSTLIFRLQ